MNHQANCSPAKLDASGLLAASTWAEQTFDGQWHESRHGQLDVLEPATGALLGAVGAGAPQDVADAVAVAQRA
jgi:benzaldehyde dehydrogenase (NAD)